MLNIISLLIAWAIFPTPLFYIGAGILGYDYNYIQAYFISLIILSPFAIGMLLIQSEV